MSVSFNPSTPQVPETQAPLCQGKHKKRLFVGEGNFSFTESFINKHDKKAGHTPEQSLAHSIVATDYKSDCDNEGCRPKKPCNECKRMIKLSNSGVKVLCGINGAKLHETESLKPYKFSRIHWNCPHDGSSMKDQTLPKLIGGFFRSCAKIQEVSDRVHITLAQPKEKKFFYQSYYYNIVRAASMTGYALIKKRRFDVNRYPGYSHVQTNNNTSASVTEEGMREFVFEKVDRKFFENALQGCINNKSIDLNRLACNLTTYSKKKCTIGEGEYYREWRNHYVCSSDDDSSDCESEK